MSRFECPGCGGGFPEPAIEDGENACPWCGETFQTLHGVSLTAESERRQFDEANRTVANGDS